jgi:Kef-type K+ transport system membrane component KefB
MAPSASAFLFPSDGLGPLFLSSQVGLVLFMFQVGSELDVREVRKMGRAVVLTSKISVLVPFNLGRGPCVIFVSQIVERVRSSVQSCNFSVHRHEHHGVSRACAHTSRTQPSAKQSWFHRHRMRSRGRRDCLVPAGISRSKNTCATGAPLLFTLAGVAIYVAMMIGVVRPLLARVPAFKRPAVSADALALILLFAFLSAWTADRLGVHALFGAFLAGVILTKSTNLATTLVQKLETVNTIPAPPVIFRI